MTRLVIITPGTDAIQTSVGGNSQQIGVTSSQTPIEITIDQGAQGPQGNVGPQGPSGSVGGSNTQVTFNDAGNAAGSNAFTFNKTSNTVTVTNITATNAAITTATITTANVTGNLKSANANLGNLVTANFFQGDGGLLSNISVAGGTSIVNGTSNVTVGLNSNVTVGVAGNANVLVVTGAGANIAGTLNATGNANVGNIGATNGVFTNVSGNGSNLSSLTGANVTGFVPNAVHANTATTATTAGTVTTAAQSNITSVGTLTNLNVTGNVLAGNIAATGAGTFNRVSGNGANLSSLTGANVTGVVANATHAVNATSATSATTAGTVTTAAQGNITSVGTLTSLAVTGNISAGNATLGNLVTANFFSGDGSSITGVSVDVGNVSGIGNIATINLDGSDSNVLYGNGIFAPVVAGTPSMIANGTSNISIPSEDGNIIISAGGTDSVVDIGNAWANFTGNIAVTGDIIANYIYATVDNANVAVTVSDNVQANITEVGTLTNLTVSGNISLTGTGVLLDMPLGDVIANTLTGTLVTNDQPNITSVGTLTSLAVTGNISAGNISATLGAFTNVSGNGSQLTDIAGANVTGTVANATHAVSSDTATSATSATTAGTVTTAAQGNITSVGTLTGLTVSGNASITNTNLVKFAETYSNLGDVSGTLTPNVAAATIFNYRLTGNITLSALSNVVAGSSATIILTQDGTGNRTLTSTMKFAGNVKTLSTAANSTDIMCVFYSGTEYFASLTKGYL